MVCSGWIAMNFGPRSQDISADHADFLGTFAANEDFSHEPTWKIYENLGYQ